MPYGWEGSRRSSDTTRVKWVVHVRAVWPSKRDWQTAIRPEKGMGGFYLQLTARL